MKLFLVSVVLFPLALAEPYAKLLFQFDYVLTGASGARILNYEYRGNDLIFTTDDYKSSNSMLLKGELVKRSRGFAIESYRANSFGSSPADCMEESSDLLRGLIVNCTGNIVLRMLTQEEKVKLIDYQLDTITSDVPFEVTVDGGRAESKSVKINQFSYERKTESQGYGALYFNSRVEPDEEELVMNVNAKLANNPFVIEGLPADSDEECGKTGLKEVKIIECKGKIKVGPS